VRHTFLVFAIDHSRSQKMLTNKRDDCIAAI